MAKLISSGKELGFTILPYALDTPIKEELVNHPSDHVLGYSTYNKETGERKFTCTESQAEANSHWSDILNEFPYCEQDGPWIIYRCSPETAELAFGKILSNYGQTLHIHNWDTWSVEGKDGKVAVVTSWEIY
jgi:hypothetical protein